MSPSANDGTADISNASADDSAKVDAEPTKEFFVSMLVRDIELIPALVDLVDNSVDGARRLRGSDRFDGLYVRIDATPDTFRIQDNCGGIAIDTARRYAFRFGRTDKTPQLPHSVGQFGVGMKRALFKLGPDFEIRSVEATSDFVLKVNVPEWAAQPSWNFEFEDHHEGVEHDLTETGTTITVQPLHPEVSADFALDSFLPRLREELRLKHRESLGRGLRISLGTHSITTEPFTLLQSERIHPAYRTLSFNGSASAPVTVNLYTGVSDSAPQDAGWYVFCNGRLILGPDRTNITVWGEGRGRQIPSWHTQFSRFRGFAFFESDDARRLPWTTTKVGVDGNSPIWRAVRRELVVMTRPVIDLLNAIDWERPVLEGEENVERLEEMVLDARPIVLEAIPTSDRFVAPERARLEAPPATSSIQYRRLESEIATVKSLLNVTTNREVGDRTFQYFLDVENDTE